MNWTAIGAIGEALGAAGVIASLLYLAAQVRAGRRSSAVEAKLESTRLLNDFIDLLIQSPERNALIRKGLSESESLSEEEYSNFSNMLFKGFWYFSAGHFQYRMGTLDESDWHEVLAVMHYWLRGPGCRTWWEKRGRSMLGPKFAKFVDSEIERLSATR